eukprot:TRINITY_DN6734_c0_g1_i1.p1 TRINITY_DN6734_c0_g1~~TRINITY_DN6734_c0_g1_i1.p1  ORF type:complete len:123 (+),score=14.04 TRINITY_DN6734_c0_g1_i1:106-474(+)
MAERGLECWFNIVHNQQILSDGENPIKNIAFIKRLTLVSKYVFKFTKYYIESNYWFKQRRFFCYQPKKLKEVNQLEDIHPSTIHLIFSKNFNLPIGNKLPHNITQLHFGHRYNHEVYFLPPN